MKNLSVKGKIVVFKTLAISKLVYLALLTVIPNIFASFGFENYMMIVFMDGR